MKKRRKRMANVVNLKKNVYLTVLALLGLSLGLYSLSFFDVKGPTQKFLPSDPGFEQYYNLTNSLDQTCGFNQGNCQVCLECIDSTGNSLVKEDFSKGSIKTGTCEYVSKSYVDGLSCIRPNGVCDGKGVCVECLADADCGPCSRCANDFFSIPGKDSSGKCIPIETMNKEACSDDGKVCSHGECIFP